MAFLPRFLAALAVACCVYIVPLRAINPEGDFRDGLLAPIVIDAREWKMSQLSSPAQRAGIDALVLGSSRSMQLGPELDARYGVHAYNLGVDSAHAEDYLALYRWAKGVGIRPRVLAIGLDLEALDDSDRVDERYARNPELVGALGDRSELQQRVDALGTELQKYKRMFTTWYLADTARSVQVHVLSKDVPPEIEALGLDGVVRYPRWDAERAAGTFDLERSIADCLPLYDDRFRDMHGLSAWRLGLLEQLFSEARTDGVSVVVWLTPLHPRTVGRLTSTTAYARLVRSAADEVARLAPRYGARWRDLSDPATFDATADGWYDCAHLDASNLKRLVAALPN